MPELEVRIAVLETNVTNMEAKLAEMITKVDEMHAILLQAKGARWAILAVAGFAGFMASKLGSFVDLFSVKN